MSWNAKSFSAHHAMDKSLSRYSRKYFYHHSISRKGWWMRMEDLRSESIKSSFNLKASARKHIISEIFFALLTHAADKILQAAAAGSRWHEADMIYEISFTRMYAAGLWKPSRWIIDNFSTTLHRSLPYRCI